MLDTKAEEDCPAPAILVGHSEAQGLCVEFLGLLGIADLQHNMAELACLDHVVPPRFLAAFPLRHDIRRRCQYRPERRCREKRASRLIGVNDERQTEVTQGAALRHNRPGPASGPSGRNDELVSCVGQYREARKETARDPDLGDVALLRYVFVAESLQIAYAIAGAPFIRSFEQTYFRWPHPVVKRPAGRSHDRAVGP